MGFFTKVSKSLNGKTSRDSPEHDSKNTSDYDNEPSLVDILNPPPKKKSPYGQTPKSKSRSETQRGSEKYVQQAQDGEAIGQHGGAAAERMDGGYQRDMNGAERVDYANGYGRER